jgi:hypothetical protein
MSISLSLAKISPELLAAVRADADLLEHIFFSIDNEAAAHAALPADFDRDRDVIGIDNFEEVIDQAAGSYQQFRQLDTWLAKAAQGTGEVLDCGFRYWGVFLLDPATVAQIAGGLPTAITEARAAAARRPDQVVEQDQQRADDARYYGDREDDEEDDEEYDEEYDESLDDLNAFYKRAAREGKAVIGGAH